MRRFDDGIITKRLEVFQIDDFGGGFWPPLAVAIAGGVGGATILALYFAPSAYLLTMCPGFQVAAELDLPDRSELELSRRTA